jgi:hypothetical protein
MKHIALIGSVFTLALSTIACGGNDNGTTPTAPTTPTTRSIVVISPADTVAMETTVQATATATTVASDDYG